MRKLNYLFALVFILISGRSFSQGMMPPSPISSPMLEAATGTWVSEPYEMMGMKCTETVTQKMVLNGQFLEVNVKNIMDNGFVYEGIGMFAPSGDGTMSGTFYDIFGKNGMMNYTGKVEGNKIIMSGANDKMTEERIITIDGDSMTSDVTFKMKDASENSMPEQKLTVTYKKK